jgi:hypothetical protein
MGFVSPKLPPFDIHFWYWGRRAERLKPMCQHWGEHGFGIPSSIYLLYALKIVAFVAGGLAFITSTPGLGSLDNVATWWTQPVVLQKAVVWSLLFEVTGLGGGFGPLTLRFLPPIGGLLYWLRPGTMRLPPWPNRVPLTKGTNRSVLDALFYLGLLCCAVWLLLSPATRVQAGPLPPAMMLDPVRFLPLAVLVPLIGLRDKTIFLAARSEHYWITLLVFFLPLMDMLVAAKVLMVLIWWGGATGKLNRLFSFAVCAMLSNAPMLPKWVRRQLYRAYPVDMRPSSLCGMLAWIGVMIEYIGPLVLLVSTSRGVTLGAIVLMILFHLTILFSMPAGVPLEWNVLIIFELVFLFWGHFAANVTNATHPLLPALIAIPIVALITWGNLRPDLISFLPAMRYYSGNWATSMWALKSSAVAKIDGGVTKCSSFAKAQLKRIYGEQVSEVVTHKAYTFRAMHHHGRALFGLLPRAAGPNHEEAFVLEGELVAGAMLGWNFGDGHLHNEQLLAALQQRCQFEPGEVRAVILESQPIGSDRQEYRIVDAAIGEVERGYVLVEDMVRRQPWQIEDLPAEVISQIAPAPGGLNRAEQLPDEVSMAVSDGLTTPMPSVQDLPEPKASVEDEEAHWSARPAGTG